MHSMNDSYIVTGEKAKIAENIEKLALQCKLQTKLCINRLSNRIPPHPSEPFDCIPISFELMTRTSQLIRSSHFARLNHFSDSLKTSPSPAIVDIVELSPATVAFLTSEATVDNCLGCQRCQLG